jgi:hypothetical protein
LLDRTSPPRRTVIQAEALAWLAAHPAEPASSIVTSLPDLSEVPELGFDGWRAWFMGAARALIHWIPGDGVAIFFQSDIRFQGAWVDKGYLIMRAADDAGATLVWHKIVCRKPAGTMTYGRASYSHMLCVARSPRGPSTRPSADVIPDAGFMPWTRAMGTLACAAACRYLREETTTRTVVDPFCGRGTALAVANAHGFDAIGVELSVKRCRAARAAGRSMIFEDC